MKRNVAAVDQGSFLHEFVISNLCRFWTGKYSMSNVVHYARSEGLRS